jgi:hypothetical protein
VAKYDIDPEGVKKVLDTTAADAEKFSTILGPLADGPTPPGGVGPTQSGIVSTAAAACGNSGVIGPALVRACLSGAAAATSAYLHGDEEMVATYQQNASKLKISEYPPK